MGGVGGAGGARIERGPGDDGAIWQTESLVESEYLLPNNEGVSHVFDVSRKCLK